MRLTDYDINAQISSNHDRLILSAIRRSDHKRVVIKTTPHDQPSRVVIEGTRREYNILQWLADSPHTPNPIEFTYENGRPLLVVEAFDGQVLDSLLDQPLDVELALQWAIRIGDAISDVHRHHVIHKDIKPSNILIHASGERAMLIDFGLAMPLSVQHSDAQPPEIIEGTLAYMSPEQTGRMSRGIDCRSDLYSFGITLYRMLTGQLPFAAKDVLEWCHCHLARAPEAPRTLRPALPAAVSDIVLRLLAKAAEARYQSAHGCSHDLRRCLREYRQTGAVADFPLAQINDALDFQIPSRLYGRGRESKTLLRCFDQAALGGQTSLAVIAGDSGSGKSFLVRELHKPVTALRGKFLSGKFEQYEGKVPHDTLLQALRSLIRQILADTDDAVATWRTRITDALGKSAGVMTAVLPDLEHLIGPHPAPPALGPSESGNRFDLALRMFIRVMARSDSPVAIFLDDMQWSDIATLRLLRSVLADSSIGHICFILAYRSNQVDASHPLTRFFDDVERAGATPTRIELSALDRDSISALLADALHAAKHADDIPQLTDIITAKTAGNPFFVTQFVTRLHEDGLLSWHPERQRFVCDIPKVAERGYTDNVVEYMVRRLRLLQPEALRAVTTAACIGSRFTLNDLCRATGFTAQRAIVDLWQAVGAGLIMLVDHTYSAIPMFTAMVGGAGEGDGGVMIDDATDVGYCFVHDRVQQAAYGLLEQPERKQIHVRIGRAWQGRTDPEWVAERSHPN